MDNTVVDVQGLFYNNQVILYVGEGDFSFSSSHATRFGVANNIVATSLDSRDALMKKYGMDAIKNIKNLTDRGAQVIHSVNALNMAEKNGSLPLYASGRSRFDVVTFNFPHAGFFGQEDSSKMIRKHTELMQNFFRNAALLLAPGGVVCVAHKCGPPYDFWNLEANANKRGLGFVGSVPFRKGNFPGYKNRRGSGKRAGETFELGEAAISMFALRYEEWIENIKGHGLQTPSKEYFHRGILRDPRSLIEGGRASLKTPLLQAIKVEVARLEHLELEKQSRLNSLKVVEKVVPLLVKTLAIHQIHTFQTSRYKNLAKHWSWIQKLALEAMEDEQEKLEEHTCNLVKEEEIYVSDDISNGALGEEVKEAFSAFVLDTSMDGPEDIHMKTDHGIDHISGLEEVYFHHEIKSCDDNRSAVPDFKAFGVSSEHREDVEDKLDEGEADYLGKRIISWVIEKILCCGMCRK